MRRTYLFELSLVELPVMLKIPAYDYLDQYNKECVNDESYEIDILVMTDLDDITNLQNMEQPKSMLCRKLMRNFFEENFGDLFIVGFRIVLEI